MYVGGSRYEGAAYGHSSGGGLSGYHGLSHAVPFLRGLAGRPSAAFWSAEQ